MSKDKKTILEQAILDANELNESIKEFGRSMFKDTFKLEIDEIIKESLAEADKDEDEDDETKGSSIETNDKDITSDEDNENSSDDINDTEAPENGENSDIEAPENGEETSEIDLDSPENGEDSDLGSEDDIVDLTGITDDNELLSVFKKITGNDGIQVVRLGDDKISFKDDVNDQEFIIDLENEPDETDDKPVYEIYDDINGDNDETEEQTPEGELDETGKYSAFGRQSIYKGRPKLHHEQLTKKISDLTKENQGLKSENLKYKKEVLSLKEEHTKIQNSLMEFKNKLKGLEVLKENLYHVNKIFVENAIRKNEKLQIVERFNNVKTIEESKNLYNTIIKEVEQIVKTNQDIIPDKIISSSVDQISLQENKIYESDSFKRTKQLMFKLNKPKK